MEDKEKMTDSVSNGSGKASVIDSTKRGDRGRTSLLSGERVSKSNLRIEACGNIDESNAAMGLAKAFSRNDKTVQMIKTIQKDLVVLGAELSNTTPGKESKRIDQEQILRLEKWIQELQMEVPLPRRFVDPGANPVSAALDMARSIVRRAERSIVSLQEANELSRPEALSYVNRLGCLLFTLARYAEKTE